MDPFIGTILLFAFNRAPSGWQLCDGTLLQIAEYSTLFNLIGTTYGGNGTTNFAVPDLRGRAPVHMGQGHGLSNYLIGQSGGVETVTLLLNQYPSHDHSLTANPTNTTATGTPGTSVSFGVAFPSDTAQPYAAGTTVTPYLMAPQALAPSIGGNLPHENMMPSLVMNFCIATAGLYPTQA